MNTSFEESAWIPVLTLETGETRNASAFVDVAVVERRVELDDGGCHRVVLRKCHPNCQIRICIRRITWP